MMNRTIYVCGFLFTANKEQVVLINKKRPYWQRGLLNGVGGKVKDKELIIDAMTREFKEEAGIEIKGWQKLCELAGDNFEVHFFCAFDDSAKNVVTLTDEKVAIYNVDNLRLMPAIENLRWLIPMCLDSQHYFAIAYAKGENNE